MLLNLQTDTVSSYAMAVSLKAVRFNLRTLMSIKPEQIATAGVGISALGLTVVNTLTAPEQMKSIIRSVNFNGHDMTREAVTGAATLNAMLFAMLVWGAFYFFQRSAQTILASR